MWRRTAGLGIAAEIIWQGRWKIFYEIFLNALIFCLRKKALPTIYYTENSGSLLGAVA